MKSSGYSKVIRHPNIGPDDQLVSNFEFKNETGKRCKSVLIIHRDEVASLKQGFLDLWEQHGEERYLGTREIIRNEEGNERGKYLWRS